MSIHEEELESDVPATEAPRWDTRVTAAESAEFAGHLAALTRTGLPLPAGLRSLAAELPSRRLSRTLLAMADGLDRGGTIDETLAAVAARFPAPLRGLMAAGARSGKLSDVLGQYVRYANLGAALRRRFWLSAAYPLFLLAALAALFMFICVWVVDALQFVLNDFGVTPPAITQVFFRAADWTRNHGAGTAVFAIVLTAVALVVIRLVLGPAERRVLQTSVPMFGPVLRWSSLAEFCHLAALLVEAEMPLPEALDLAGRGVNDAELARAGHSLRAEVETGWTFSDALRAWPRCPAGLTEVLAEPEGRGDLAPALHLAGDMFEARARAQANFLNIFLAAISLLFVIWGGGVVVTALYLPMISLITKLSG